MVLLDGPCAVNDEAHARRESSTRNTESSTSHEHGTRTTDTTADPSLSTRRREPQPNSAVAVTGSRRTWSDRLVLSQGRGTLERTRVPVRCRAAPRRAARLLSPLYPPTWTNQRPLDGNGSQVDPLTSYPVNALHFSNHPFSKSSRICSSIAIRSSNNLRVLHPNHFSTIIISFSLILH